MGAAFGFDFGRVRVHADGALPPDALAGTTGTSIRFAPGAYRPDTADGRRLLAHELAHVVQQSRPGPVDPAEVQERDADAAAGSVAAGRTPNVSAIASPRRTQFFKVTRGTTTYEVGDVVLNAAAITDVTTHGNLLAGPDQAHVYVNGTQLGYDINHTTPQDPFRWEWVKRFVDKEHIDIRGVADTDSFSVKEATATGPPTIVKRTLIGLGFATGITLPRLSRARAIEPGRNFYVASPDDARDQVYFATGAAGRGTLGSNSLAHELFGHLALAVSGAPWRHTTGPVPQATGVKDPFGQPFVGQVDDYISRYAGASGLAGPLESPTYNVGPSFLSAALTELKTNGTKGLSGSRATGWKTTPDFDRNWKVLSQNYRALKAAVRPPPTTGAAPVPTAASVLTEVTAWKASLNADQGWVFDQYLDKYTLQIIANKPQELANELILARPRVP